MREHPMTAAWKSEHQAEKQRINSPLNPKKQPTIYEALCAKLGREPTNAELCDDVKRILREGAEERMTNANRPKKARH